MSGRVTPMPSIPYTREPTKSLKPPQCTHKLNTAVCRRSPMPSPFPRHPSSLLASCPPPFTPLSKRTLCFFVVLLHLCVDFAQFDTISYICVSFGERVLTYIPCIPQLSRGISNFYGNHIRAEFLLEKEKRSLLSLTHLLGLRTL